MKSERKLKITSKAENAHVLSVLLLMKINWRILKNSPGNPLELSLGIYLAIFIIKNRENVEALVNKVLTNIRPKIIQGKALTGEMFLNLTNSYVQALNSGGVPQILTSMERVVSSEMKKIYDNLAKEYTSIVEDVFHESKLPIPEDELVKKHREIVNAVLKKLAATSEIIGQKEVQMVQQRLTVGFDKTLQNKIELNEEKITVASQKIINQFMSQLRIPNAAEIQDGFSDIRLKLINPFKESFQNFYESFSKGLKGSKKKYMVLSDLLPKQIIDYFEKIIDTCEAVKESELEVYRDKLAQAREGEEHLRKALADNQSYLKKIW